MRNAIILALATAWLAAPAIAETSGSKDTSTPPSVQRNGASASQTPQPRSPADKRDDAKKGLSRNPDDCNKGCLGGNPP
jgi:hypothetical protein